MKKCILISLLLLVIIFSGCSSIDTNSTDLTKENNTLKLQLKEADGKITKYEKTNEVRNITDLVFFDLMNYMIRGDYDKAKALLTSNVTLANGVLKSTKQNAEFKINKSTIFRQRWYELSDENSMMSGYECYNTDESDKLIEIDVKFKFDDSTWKIDSFDFNI